jgi:hypothetical protein
MQISGKCHCGNIGCSIDWPGAGERLERRKRNWIPRVRIAGP